MAEEYNIDELLGSAREYLKTWAKRDEEKFYEIKRELEKGNCGVFFDLTQLLGDLGEGHGLCMALGKLGVLSEDTELRKLCGKILELHDKAFLELRNKYMEGCVIM